MQAIEVGETTTASRLVEPLAKIDQKCKYHITQKNHTFISLTIFVYMQNDKYVDSINIYM